MSFFFFFCKLAVVFALVNADNQNSDSVVNRVTQIAERYSNWALGEPNNYQLQPPPRYYNTAPVKQFFHSVKIQPPPKPPVFHHPNPHVTFYPTTPSPVFTTPYPTLPVSNIPRNVTKPPFYYQQIPPPARLSQLPPEHNQRFHYPMRSQPSKEYVSMNPNFPRLLESQIPLPTSPVFPANTSNLPPHMSSNFGSSVLSQLLSPILPESLAPSPSVVLPSPPLQQKPSVVPSFIPLDPLPEPSKEEVMKVASKKRLFGFPRFPMEPRAFGPSCLSGWCGDECCDVRRQFSPTSTTIQATAMPGSLTPPHPLVLVVHPSPPLLPQCSPACQPQCSQQCVARLQYMQEAHFYNSIVEPTCRPDCMPSCHVDCLIIPPQRVRCNSFHCQCLAGYVQCAAFTCCMRYPNMAARMRSNVLAKSSEEIGIIEEVTEGSENERSRKRLYTPIKVMAQRENSITHDIEDVTSIPKRKSSYWTKNKSSSYEISTVQPTTTTTTTTPLPCPTTSTTTTTTPVPTTKPTTTTTTTTSTTTTTAAPTTTTPSTTTTTMPPTTTTSKPVVTSTRGDAGVVMNMTPIYPDMMKNHKVPMIPAYGLWAIPHSGSPKNSDASVNEKRNSVGDIRGRHVIRSENFLDVLSELAQVKMKEDITDDFSQAATFIEFMTDNIRKL